MKRGRKPQAVNLVLGTEQYIGHISAPIEDYELERVQTILKSHGVDLRKIRTPDDWWLLFFPDGTVKIGRQTQEKVLISVIRMPDGFSFLIAEGSFDCDGNYAIPPKVFVEKVQAEGTLAIFADKADGSG